MEQEKVAVVRQRQGKHVSAATNQHATIEELLEVVFSMRSAPRLCNEKEWVSVLIHTTTDMNY
jgi:hypothetical protein